jgi:hypothetical protein
MICQAVPLKLLVLCRRLPAGTGPGDWLGQEPVAVDGEQQFGAGAHEVDAGELQERRVRRRVHPPERGVSLDGMDRRRGGESLRDVRLEGVPLVDVLLDALHAVGERRPGVLGVEPGPPSSISPRPTDRSPSIARATRARARPTPHPWAASAESWSAGRGQAVTRSVASAVHGSCQAASRSSAVVPGRSSSSRAMS